MKLCNDNQQKLHSTFNFESKNNEQKNKLVLLTIELGKLKLLVGILDILAIDQGSENLFPESCII